MPAKFTARISDQGVITHIYNEGIEKKQIFREDTDYEAFVGFIKEYLSPSQDYLNNKTNFTINGKTYAGKPHIPKNYFGKVELLAYSLLPNHFHIILHQIEKGSIERFVRSLCTRYSMYFNKKYVRTGALLNGPYKSVQINTISELINLSKHIHSRHTPLQISKSEVAYSSYYEYAGLRLTPWINTLKILSGLSENLSEATKMYRGFLGSPQKESEIKDLKNVAFDFQTHDIMTESNVKSHADSSSQSSHSTQKTYANKLMQRKKIVNVPLTHRTPELFVLTVLFMFLFSIGIQNTRAKEAMQNPEVLAEKTIEIVQEEDNTKEYEITPTPSERDVLNNLADASEFIEGGDTEVLGATSPVSSQSADTVVSSEYVLNETPTYSLLNADINKTAVIKIEDGSPLVYIYKYPTVDSEVIGMAISGERFGYLSTISDWQEIKFNITTIGFVLKKYTYIENQPL